MESIKFNSAEELYKRLKPALDAKESELHNLGYKYIRSVDIWNVLKRNKWKDSSNLTLHEMVDDILNTDSAFYDESVKLEFNKLKREPELEEDNIL